MADRFKIPPVDLDAIVIAREERLSARSDLKVAKDRIPLYYGAGVHGTTSRPLEAPTVTESEARKHAEDIYVRILKLLLKGEPLGFTTDESTYAVTLLYTDSGALGRHFRIIVTFSQYDRTYTSTTLRGIDVIASAMIEADPEYKMMGAGHSICRNGEWRRYDREGNNEHHAEARALVFASKNEMLILSIMPTKEFCTTGASGGCQADVKAVLKEETFAGNHERMLQLFG